MSIHYARERGWYIREILKAHSVEEKRLKIEKKFSSDQNGQEQVLKTKKRKARAQ